MAGKLKTEYPSLFDLGDSPTEKRTFDLAEGQKRKDRGMSAAAENTERERLLEIARELAEHIAKDRTDRRCNADMVYRRMLQSGYNIKKLGNAAGSIFKESGKWQNTGERVQSVRITNHARWIFVWQLREG